MTRAALLALVTSLALAWPAGAEENITGAWSFKTDIKRKGCTITGNMTISPPEESGARTCSFVSTETCSLDGDTGAWQMDQVCRITPQGDRYIFRSKVIGTLTDGYNAQNYLPDHFVVKPESDKRMTGIWQDSAYSAPVIFWRDDSLPVS